MRSGGRSPHDRITFPIRKGRDWISLCLCLCLIFPLSLSHVTIQQEGTVSKAGDGPHRNLTMVTHDLALASLSNCERETRVVQAPSLWYFVTAA